MSPRWTWTSGAPITAEAFLEEALWSGFIGDPLPLLPSHLVGRLSGEAVLQAWEDGNLARVQRGPARPFSCPPWLDRLA